VHSSEQQMSLASLGSRISTLDVHARYCPLGVTTSQSDNNPSADCNMINVSIIGSEMQRSWCIFCKSFDLYTTKHIYSQTVAGRHHIEQKSSDAQFAWELCMHACVNQIVTKQAYRQ